jgi:hypothetical protein
MIETARGIDQRQGEERAKERVETRKRREEKNRMEKGREGRKGIG